MDNRYRMVAPDTRSAAIESVVEGGDWVPANAQASAVMKIAYVFQNPELMLSEPQGTQLHINQIIKGLQLAGHNVTLLKAENRGVLAIRDPKDIGTRAMRGVPAVKLGFTGSKLFRTLESGVRRTQTELRSPYFAVWDSLRVYDACRQSISGFHLLYSHFDLFGVGAALASRRMMIPMVLDCEADYFDELRYLGDKLDPLQEQWGRRCATFCFQTAQAVVSVSQQLREHLIRNWRIPPSKIHVLPNNAEIEAFGLTETTGEWRKKLGLGEEPIVLFVGGFFKWHALDQLVLSFAEVHKVVPSCRLLLVGDGPTRRDVEAKINELGIQNAVLFTGMLDHQVIPSLLGLAHVTVAPFAEFFSGKGGSPLKLFEYMASGKAIVATATGQVAEVMIHATNGLLVNPGDVHGFAAAIVQLLSDPAERERLGRNAREQALHLHSLDQHVRRLQKINLSISQGKSAALNHFHMEAGA